jgi:hypothetical protein
MKNAEWDAIWAVDPNPAIVRLQLRPPYELADSQFHGLQRGSSELPIQYPEQGRSDREDIAVERIRHIPALSRSLNSLD